MDKDTFIKYYIDKGWSAKDALGEWGLHVIEEEMGEIAKKKTKKKDTQVASLRSSKDKKFMGHTGRA
jgi:hypothetical protein|tara:strand:+ start:301 stop:501 length:201 start_codon:yes stop_codon:yes gene_type:complete